MVTAIIRYAGFDEVETAEDIVQETFAAALKNWAEKGIPGKPDAWLFTVCRNKALNVLRLHDSSLTGLAVPDPMADAFIPEDTIPDEQLRMLFACANAVISPKAQVMMILKYVVNLRTNEIASAFGSSEDAVEKLLGRSRKKFRETYANSRLPVTDQLQQRLPVVHKAIYLIFNAGFGATTEREINHDLCLEALALMRALQEGGLHNDETKPLYALMLFNAARLESRISRGGELIDLENQDRSLWNKQMIALGTHVLQSCKRDQNLSGYHIEATISYLHCISPSFIQTDWQTIATLYLKLKDYNPSPFVELSRAAAILFGGEARCALEILLELKTLPWMAHYHLFHVTHGKVLGHLEDHSNALRCFEEALKLACIPAEQQYIQRLICKTASQLA